MLVHDKLAFIEQILGASKYSETTKDANFKCIFDGCSSVAKNKKKLCVNIKTDLYHCWVCESKGHGLLGLLRQAGASKEQLHEYREKYATKKETEEVVAKEEVFRLALPPEFQLVSEMTGKEYSYSKVVGYLEKRGLDTKEIKKRKIGYCPSGQYSNRVVVPSFGADGRVNFFAGRSLSKVPSLKYLSPLVPKGYKNSVIINELNLDFSTPLVVVEGFFDAFKSIDNTVPLCGSFLNKDSALFRKIMEYNTTVTLALDSDALSKSISVAGTMLSYGLNVRLLDVSPFKDVGEMNKAQFLERYAAAIELDEQKIFNLKVFGTLNA